MALQYDRFDKLSEQEVIECARNKYSYALLGCNGGYHYSVYDHARDSLGVTTLANKPYKERPVSSCNIATPRVPKSKVASYYSLPYGDEEAMKQALFNKGPLYVTIHASGDLGYYKTGVYTDYSGSCKANNNHAVLLVGYGNENGLDYWLLKNSYGMHI